MTRDDEMPKDKNEIIAGVSWGKWFATMHQAMADPDNGLSEIKSQDICNGGFCNRHSRPNPEARFPSGWMRPRGRIKYETSSGLKLCRSCGQIWATRKRLGLAHGNDDL